MKMNMREIFTYAPFAVLALSFLVFVLRARLKPWPKMLWFLWLAVCFSKFYCFRMFGGHVFYPEFPQALIVLWDVAYSGALMLTLIAVPFFFFRFRFKAVLLPLIAWTTAAVGVWNGVKVPIVHEIELAFPDLPASLEGYRIAQISDLHCSSAARKWRTGAIVEKVNSLNADLICLTGDYVDGYVADRGVDMLPLKNLKARDGVYYVAGNHEFYRDGVNWDKWYRENGMRFLVNECVFPRPELALGGVNDIVANQYKRTPPDVRQAFAAATNGEFRVLLQHRPETAKDNIGGLGVNLQLSGHTHGGVAPVVRQLVSKHNRGFSRGIYRYGDGILYVSPGAGQWAGFPIRFCNPSEVAVFKLVGRKKVDGGGN